MYNIEKRYIGEIIIFIAGIIIGTILANVEGKNYLERIGILAPYFKNEFLSLGINRINLLIHISVIRIVIILIITGFGFTIFNKICIDIFLLYYGFCHGFLLSIAFMMLGIMGLPFYIVTLLPHYVFYIFGIILLIIVNTNRKEISLKHKLQTFTIIFLAIIGGILTETYINPLLLRYILILIKKY